MLLPTVVVTCVVVLVISLILGVALCMAAAEGDKAIAHAQEWGDEADAVVFNFPRNVLYKNAPAPLRTAGSTAHREGASMNRNHGTRPPGRRAL